MIGWTLCSGIGAPEMAAPWVDWRLASEVEPFPRAVLAERFGYKADGHNQGDPLLWGDMCEVTPDLARKHGIPLPDVLVAGTPCQAFSVAGLRNGVKDPRGNLTLKFVEIVHELVAARPDGRLCVVWENVPGVLSDKENAFGCFLAGLIGASDPLRTPDGGRWPSSGMACGPRARLAWRVLDAQYFGLAQRRRRVFVVVDFGNIVDPAAVLFERQGREGNTPPSREAGQRPAGSLSARTASGGGLGTDFDVDGGLQPWPADLSCTLNTKFGDKMGLEDQHALNGTSMFVPAIKKEDDCFGTLTTCSDEAIIPVTSHTLRGEGFDAGEDGTGRATPLVPVAFDCKDYKARETDVAQPLMAGVPVGGNQGGDNISEEWAVRRLTPTECARLQGFPDDHCAITYRGKQAADGPQYKAYGNSMAVPVVSWIMQRLRESMT